MAHDHDHSHDENYFLDQVATVAACGLLAGIGFLSWKIRLFDNYNMLTSQFDRLVMIGSVALAGLVVVRGTTLWKEAGRRRTHSHAHGHSHDHHHHHEDEHGEHCDHHHHDHDHGHTHEHGESCGHDHHHHHDHGDGAEQAHQQELYADHGHSHGFAPWRYAVLLLPLMLSGLLVYYSFAGLELRYSTERLIADLHNDELEGGDNEKEVKGDRPWAVNFKELPEAAASPAGRDRYEGKLVEISGLFSPLSDKEFTLFRRKMTCCAPDSVPVKVRIFFKGNLSNKNLQVAKGASVVGQAEFRKIKGSEEYVAVIIARDVKPVELGNEIFIRD